MTGAKRCAEGYEWRETSNGVAEDRPRVRVRLIDGLAGETDERSIRESLCNWRCAHLIFPLSLIIRFNNEFKPLRCKSPLQINFDDLSFRLFGGQWILQD